MRPTFSRRHFLKMSALGSVAMLAGNASAFPGSFRLRYVLASSLYGMMPLAEVLAEVRKTGAEHIDIWPMKHANHREQIESMGFDAFAALLKKHKVKLGVLSHYDLGPFGLQTAMPFAKQFGARILISNSRGPKNLSGDGLKAEVKKFAEQIKPHIGAAEEHKVIIGIENHAGGLIASPDSIRWLIDFVSSKHLGIALAPYHLEQDSAMIAKLIEDLGERLVLFYAWQHGHGSVKKLPKEEELMQMPGRGELDLFPWCVR